MLALYPHLYTCVSSHVSSTMFTLCKATVRCGILLFSSLVLPLFAFLAIFALFALLLPFLIVGVRRVLLDRLYGGLEQRQSWSNGYGPAYLVGNWIVGLSTESALNSRLATTKVASVAAQHGEFEMLRLEVRICVQSLAERRLPCRTSNEGVSHPG